jgi:hypothetical protein
MYKNKQLEAIYHAIPNDHDAKTKITVLFALLDNFVENNRTADETLHGVKMFLEGEKAKAAKAETTSEASVRLKAYLKEKDKLKEQELVEKKKTKTRAAKQEQEHELETSNSLDDIF